MSMLGLVVATNIFQMYLFWELVGVCSYLLIGFYYPKHEAVHASKKAFIVTRFADLFFLIGILFYSFYVGTFNYDFEATPDLQSKLAGAAWVDRKSTRLNSSHANISYAVFCLKK